MKLARRWNRRAASTKTRRKATKDFIRRGLLAERLEDRTLMAADLSSLLGSSHSNFYNFGKPNDVNADGVVAPSDLMAIINSLNGYGAHELSLTGAEGESRLFLDTNDDGSVTPIDMMRVITQLNAEGEGGAALAKYAITIYPDATSTTPITSIGQNSDFYMAISTADLRPDGTYGDGVTPLLRGIVAAYTDVTFDKNFVQVAVSEVQNLKINNAGTGSFTLSLNGKTSPTINYDTTNVAGTTPPGNVTLIQNADRKSVV